MNLNELRVQLERRSPNKGAITLLGEDVLALIDRLQNLEDQREMLHEQYNKWVDAETRAVEAEAKLAEQTATIAVLAELLERPHRSNHYGNLKECGWISCRLAAEALTSDRVAKAEE